MTYILSGIPDKIDSRLLTGPHMAEGGILSDLVSPSLWEDFGKSIGPQTEQVSAS